MAKVTRVEYTDWEAYYVDDQLVFENTFLHNNGLRELLAALNIEYEEEYTGREVEKEADGTETKCAILEALERGFALG